jgi:hypothetical protein
MRTIFIAGVIAATLASAASAQSRQRAPDPERAAALISEAQMLDFTRDRQRIAKLYEKASTYQAAADPQAAYSLMYAAQFYYAAGNKQRATDVLERAAQLAIARNAAVEAADYYILAAVTTTELQEPARTRRLTDSVLSLVANREMSETDRVRLLKRIAPAPTLADK